MRREKEELKKPRSQWDPEVLDEDPRCVTIHPYNNGVNKPALENVPMTDEEMGKAFYSTADLKQNVNGLLLEPSGLDPLGLEVLNKERKRLGPSWSASRKPPTKSW